MKLYAVVGKPILHSRSPQIHGALAQHDPAVAYGRVRADDPEQVIALLRDGVFAGLNVTAPFKEALLPRLDHLDESAAATGAVNTVVVRDGRLEGANTDPAGVAGALQAAGIGIAGLDAVVLGAGGAGRAAVFALKKNGAQVTVVNRTEARARVCAVDFGCLHEPWANLRQVLAGSRLIVSTLAVERIPFPAEWLPQTAVVLDADYRSRPLARAAVERGLPTVDGTEWLLFQALAAFQRFHDFPAAHSAIDAARTVLRAPIEKKRGAALIGFMGSGKSTIGPKLAAALNWSFIDIDSRIEQQERMTVAEIFRQKGEAHFRRLEREAVLFLSGRERTLIACGGGAVLDPQVRQSLRCHGLVIWLYLPLAETRKRDLGGRPLLGPGAPEAEKIFEQRKFLYGETADLLVFNQKEPEEVARDIADEIGPFIDP